MITDCWLGSVVLSRPVPVRVDKFPESENTMDDDDIQAKDIEEKLKSQSSTRLSSTRYLLREERFEAFGNSKHGGDSETMLSCYLGDRNFILKLNKSDTGKPNLLDRLRGALHLLSQMTEPILKAASGISILLAYTSPSPLLEGDENVGVTASESSTPLAEAASSKTNNG
ncbi:hypothetical protein HID58_018564 [Brassica napus]|uniref:Inositol-pentakisphosphate 2-kinase n=1 Tax=Brassica napus TaxID=3708 RepID=A0ABQ8DAA6_BRANA|nr:hypothetical protein HID58_018564 [Brassica napus]